MKIVQKSVGRDCPDATFEGECLISSVNDVDILQIEVGQRSPHGGRDARRRRPLDLEPQPQASPHDQQIDLGAAVSRPKIAFFGMDSKPSYDLLVYLEISA